MQPLSKPQSITTVSELSKYLSSMSFDGQTLESEQIVQLVNLKLNDGSVMLLEKETNLLYEVIGSLYQVGFDMTYAALSSNTYEKGISVILALPLNANSSYKFNRDIENFHAVEKRRGIFKCRNMACRSDNTTQVEMQTRSGDEQSTIFVTCEDCGYRYRIG